MIYLCTIEGPWSHIHPVRSVRLLAILFVHKAYKGHNIYLSVVSMFSHALQIKGVTLSIDTLTCHQFSSVTAFPPYPLKCVVALKEQGKTFSPITRKYILSLGSFQKGQCFRETREVDGISSSLFVMYLFIRVGGPFHHI